MLCQLDRNADMSSLGGRPSAAADFTAEYYPSSSSTPGKLKSLHITDSVTYGTQWGAVMEGLALFDKCQSLNAYDSVVPALGLKMTHKTVITDQPPNSIMRCPGHFQGCFFTENAVEAVAADLGVDVDVVQEANLDPDTRSAWAALKAQVGPPGGGGGGVPALKASIAAFNKAHRWRKRGMHMMPQKYKLQSNIFVEKVLLAIHSDGSVVVDHSGIEMGQGINTKVLQAVSMELGKTTPGTPLAMSKLQLVEAKSTDLYSSATPTWGSGTSEVVVGSAIKACDILNKVLKKYAAPGQSWEQIVSAAAAAGADLSSTSQHQMLVDGGTYSIYAAACSVVELDALTGENEILSADIVYDCGVSLNPEIDIGQVEGCFVQAAGMLLTEEQTYSKSDGRLISNGTWDYKPPSSLDIPIKMR